MSASSSPANSSTLEAFLRRRPPSSSRSRSSRSPRVSSSGARPRAKGLDGLDVRGEIFEVGLGLVDRRRGATARSWAVRVCVHGVGVGVGLPVWPRRAVRRHPRRRTSSGSSSSARSAMRGSASPSRRGSTSRSGHSVPAGKSSAPKPCRRSATARGVGRSLAHPPDREAAAVPGLGRDRAGGSGVPGARATLDIGPALGRRRASAFGLEVARSGQPACWTFRPEVRAGRDLARSFPFSPPGTDRRSPAAAPGRLIEPR